MATLLCGTIEVTYKVTGWSKQGLTSDHGQVYWSFDSTGSVCHIKLFLPQIINWGFITVTVYCCDKFRHKYTQAWVIFNVTWLLFMEFVKSNQTTVSVTQ